MCIKIGMPVQVCLGYLENEDFGLTAEFINSGAYHIEIAGKRFPVRVNVHSPSLPMVSQCTLEGGNS